MRVRVVGAALTATLALGVAEPALAGPAVEAPDDALDLRPRFSLPLELGYTVELDADDGVAVGVRPELIIAPSRRATCLGVGAYLEAMRVASGDSALGGGVTVVRYGELSTALSVGVAVRSLEDEDATQLVVSGFIGWRTPLYPRAFDLPFGLRFDVRPASGIAPTAISATVTLDVVAASYALRALGAGLAAVRY